MKIITMTTKIMVNMLMELMMIMKMTMVIFNENNIYRI